MVFSDSGSPIVPSIKFLTLLSLSVRKSRIFSSRIRRTLRFKYKFTAEIHDSQPSRAAAAPNQLTRGNLAGDKRCNIIHAFWSLGSEIASSVERAVDFLADSLRGPAWRRDRRL